MGVTNLWSELLSTCEADVPMSDLSGETIAVDLSTWIVEFRKLEATQKFGNLYLRNLFHRVLHLLKHGIKLVFVCDGRAPEVKQAAMLQRQENGCKASGNLDRTNFRPFNEKCKEMLKCFGLPCIQSDGEAEALCAHLNKTGCVDGVMTNDSDVFLYGARTVYRNFRKDHNDEYVVDIYCSDKIKDDLKLNQRSLIAMGLLIGCDYDKKGVENVGPKKAKELMDHLHQVTDDPLKRICNWRTNEKLLEYQTLLESSEHKEAHCTCCNHLGTRKIHENSGCTDCEMERSCDPDNGKKCQCKHHVMKQHDLELRLRSRALKDEAFPNQEIIDEFLHGSRVNIDLEISWKSMELRNLHNFLDINYIRSLTGVQFYEKLTPVLAYLHLQKAAWCLNDELTIKPQRIINYCKVNFKPCIKIEWTKLASDTFTASDFYILTVEKEIFGKCYPDMVEEYDKKIAAEKAQKGKQVKEKAQKRKVGKEKTQKAKKRKTEEPEEPLNQTFLTSFFSTTKTAKIVNKKDI